MKLLINLSLLSVAFSQGVFELHGSGTSNPSKCYWSIFDQLKREASKPLSMSYRSIGSGNGQKEFQAGFTNETLINMFGSGDIPVPTDMYNAINDGGASKFVHFPVLAGAISFFYNLDYDGLKLTPCILSGIYNGDISSWGDGSIVALNPDLPQSIKDLPIIYGTRKGGSSSTSSSTQYLSKACTTNQKLKENLVGKLPPWPELDVAPRRRECSKSNGMVDCINAEKGTIGYIDIGHGHGAGLREVRLRNKAGAFVTTRKAAKAENVAELEKTIDTSLFPTSPDGDFADVSFLDTEATDAWPIMQMTYVYVRKDLTFIDSPAEQGLLIRFLESLYDDDFVEVCGEEFGFVLMSKNTDVQNYARQAFNLLTTPSITWEKDDDTIAGAGEYVISDHRNSHVNLALTGLTGAVEQLSKVESSTNTGFVDTLDDEVAALKTKVKDLEEDLQKLQKALEEVTGTEIKTNLRGAIEEDDQDGQIQAAIVLASISFVFWLMWIAAYVYKFLGGGAPQSQLSSA